MWGTSQPRSSGPQGTALGEGTPPSLPPAPLTPLRVLRVPTSPAGRPPPPCQPRTHLVFLKTHKTGGSSVVNLLHRFGEGRGLRFALPHRYQFGYPNPFRAERVKGYRPGGPPFDIICHHMRFNLTEVPGGGTRRAGGVALWGGGRWRILGGGGWEEKWCRVGQPGGRGTLGTWPGGDTWCWGTSRGDTGCQEVAEDIPWGHGVSGNIPWGHRVSRDGRRCPVGTRGVERWRGHRMGTRGSGGHPMGTRGGGGHPVGTRGGGGHPAGQTRSGSRVGQGQTGNDRRGPGDSVGTSHPAGRPAATPLGAEPSPPSSPRSRR